MSELIKNQKEFYEEKFQRFGEDPRSLGHNDRESQWLRFETLARLFRHEPAGARFSVHEMGCGLAHFNEYLLENKISCSYSGSDICGNFIERARAKFPQASFVLQNMAEEFEMMTSAVKGHDYYVASGVFNPSNGRPAQEWEAFLFKAIGNMFRACRKGIAFNLLTSYSHESRRSRELYYSDPKKMFDWCKTNLSRFVNVLEDTPLYEYTVLVYKKEFIRSLYSAPFDKYFRN